jgi:sulfur carrier protein ThiS adenylyltransferase
MNEFYDKLKKATVGIAGLGGLGSTVAVALARTAIGNLIIADFDTIEESNLNRQHYFLNQIGEYKTDAMIENLKQINPQVKVKGYKQKLTAGNIPEIFAEVDVIAECFDKAEQKKMLVETVLTKMERVVVVTVSGLAGYGRSNEIVTSRISNRLIVIGDGKSGTDLNLPLTAGRVWLAASHQANAVVEILVDEIIK